MKSQDVEQFLLNVEGEIYSIMLTIQESMTLESFCNSLLVYIVPSLLSNFQEYCKLPTKARRDLSYFCDSILNLPGFVFHFSLDNKEKEK